ncbi:hypothetical protein ACOMHN_046571 [Nucella lapillus]
MKPSTISLPPDSERALSLVKYHSQPEVLEKRLLSERTSGAVVQRDASRPFPEATQHAPIPSFECRWGSGGEVHCRPRPKASATSATEIDSRAVCRAGQNWS